MNFIPITQTVQAQGQGLEGLRGLLGGERLIEGDPFVMLLQQLIAGSGQEDDQPAGLQFFPGQAREPKREQSDESCESVQLAMQMLAETLAVPAYPTVATPEAESAAAQTAAPVALPLTLPKGFTDQPAVGRQPAGQDAPVELAEFGRTAPQSVQSRTAVEPIVIERPVVTAAGEEQPLEQLQFQTSLKQVHQNLRAAPERETAREIDIERLQADVDAKRFVPETAVSQTALPEPKTEEVIKQLQTGILQNVGQNKEEFVIKLRPEGLGEITVKMVEKEGKVALSILTSSAQVARALSLDVAALQNSLRPLQAEVQEIAVAQDNMSGQQQYAFTDRQFTRQQQFDGQSQSSAGRISTIERLDEAPQPILAGGNGLDAYI